MSILYDDEQRAIAGMARRVLDARVVKERLLALLEPVGRYDESFWDTAVEQGWTALAIPEEHGGVGLGLVELGVVAQATGAGTAGAPFLTFNDGAARALLEVGGALAQSWLPKLANGEATAAVAFAEGNSPLPQRPTTQVVGGRLTGGKEAVAGGLRADVAVVLADAAGTPTVAIAELSDVQRTPIDSFDNSRLYADLAFAGVPASIVAEGPAAQDLARRILARMAVVAAHEQVGGAEALLHLGRDYALERKAFGQPIGAFQSVKHRLAELYGRVEIARANCLHAASLDGQASFVAAAAAARLSATEAYDTAARDVIQIHGAIGVTWESGLHLHLRRARSLAVELGNTLFWEDLLAEALTGVAA